MLFHTHILLGISFFLLFKDLFPQGNALLFFLFVLLGSIFPDIDEQRSKMNQWSGIFGKIINFFTQHRGIFHSLIFAFIISLAFSLTLNPIYGQGLFLGYLSHILGDMLTPLGVKPLLPFSHFKIRGPIRVGGLVETIVLFVFVVFIVVKLFV